MSNAKKLTDLTEREQKELIFKLMTCMRKDDTFFMVVEDMTNTILSNHKIIDDSTIVRVIT